MSEKDNRQDFLQLLKEQEQEALDPEFSSLIGDSIGDSIGEIKTLVQDKVEKSSSLIDKNLPKQGRKLLSEKLRM